MMTSRHFRVPVALAGLVLFAGGAALALAAEAKSKAPGGTAKQNLQQVQAARFKEIEDRLEALYRYRKEPKPDPRFNPFRAPGTVPAPVSVAAAGEGAKLPEAAETVGQGTSPGASLALLQQGVANLRISGNLEIGGQAHLIINAKPCKEGDVVQTLVQGETVYLRVKEIARRTVTLSLNDAEVTLKY